jgi:GNAT superfamily N-acetyltransferase
MPADAFQLMIKSYKRLAPMIATLESVTASSLRDLLPSAGDALPLDLTFQALKGGHVIGYRHVLVYRLGVNDAIAIPTGVTDALQELIKRGGLHKPPSKWIAWARYTEVDTAHRGAGIATDLANRSEAWLKSRGLPLVAGSFEEANPRGIQEFQKRHGNKNAAMVHNGLTEYYYCMLL